MKTKFTIAGALVGALLGIGVMLVAFVKGPGHPGFYEVLVQIAIVGALALPTALMGRLVTWFAVAAIGGVCCPALPPYIGGAHATERN